MKLYRKLLVLTLVFLLCQTGGGAIATESAGENETDIVASYVDDKINISDEAFYGEYNEATGQWTQPGYLNYEEYPDMEPIQTAARRGDYQTAKEEALEYYRDQYASYTQLPARPSTTDRLQVTLMQNNVQLNNNSNYGLYGIMTFGKESSRVTLDLLPFINSIASKPDKQITFYLMGLKKDGTSVSISSSETGIATSPVLEITSKGVTQTLYPTDDASISPAENKTVNYGDESELLVEESVSSIHSEIMVDKNTKRSLIKFSLNIDSSTTPTRAELCLTGFNAGEGSGEVIVMGFPSNSWNQDGVTWYSGDGSNSMEHGVFSNYGLESFTFLRNQYAYYPKDGDIRFCSFRYPGELIMFAWTGHYTRVYMSDPAGNEDIARGYLRHWIGYLNQHGNTPRYTVGLDGSRRDTTVPAAMQWFIDSSAMTADVWSATLKHMWLEMNANITVADTNNNWRTYQALGLSTLLAYYKEFRIFDDAFEQLQYLVETNSEGMLNDDGSSMEAATGYAASAVQNLVKIDDPFGYARMNVSSMNDATRERIMRAAQYILDIVMPGGHNLQWGDDTNYEATQLSVLSRLGRSLDMPELTYVGSGGEQGTKPTAQAVRYMDMGVHVMRTGWDEAKDISLFTDIDGGKGSHAHADDLSVILYAYGQYLLTDQAFYTYSTATTFDLADTEHHNTVLFNGENQQTTSGVGDSLRFETNDAYDNFTLRTKAYEPNGLSYTRNYLFIKPYYFIVNDYLVPNEQVLPNNYKQQWHLLPQANPSIDEAYFTGRSNFLDTANIQVAQANIQDMSTPELADGLFSLGNNTLYNTKKIRFEKNAAGNTLFDTVLYPEKKGESAEVVTQQLPLKNVVNNGATAMSIHIDSTEKYADAQYYLVHDTAQQQERSFGKNQTDGRSAYVEYGKNERLSMVILQDATILKDTDRDITLFQSSEAVSEFAATFSGSQVMLETADDIDLSKLTLYADNPVLVKEVYQNGTQIPFKLAGRYIYFGDSPILVGGSFDSSSPGIDCEEENRNSGHASNAGGVNKGGGAGTVSPVPSAVPTTQPVAPVTTDIPEAYMQEIEGHWGKDELIEIVQKGILAGEGQTLNLDGNTSRAVFTTILLRALDIEPAEYRGVFDDVSEDDWFSGYVQAAKDAGLIDGVSDGIFAPHETITREQAAKLLVTAYTHFSAQELPTGEARNFSDASGISDWAVPFVQKAGEIGIMIGDEAGAFLPKKGIVRAEAAVTVYRLSKLI